MLIVMNLSLDHVGLVSRAAGVLLRTYTRLGFALTAPQELERTDAMGRRSSLGQSSCHAVMQHGYIELSEVHSTDPAHHLASYLQRGPGLHILALGTNDIAGMHRRYVAARVPCSDVSWAARDIAYGEQHGAARFEWFMVTAAMAPDGLLCVVRNHTPELVYQQQVMHHPNGATGLRGLVVACADVAASARRYERLLGVAATSAGADRRLALAGGAIVLRPVALAHELHGTDASDGRDRYAALLVSVRDTGRAADWLGAQGVPMRARGDEVHVRSEDAAGAALVLVPD